MSTLNEATQWAQANPNDPRAKGVLARAWAMQNPSDPRSAQILQKLEQSVQQSQNPQQIPDAADKAAQGGRPDAKPTMNLPPAYTPGGTPAQASLDNPEVTKGFAKAGVGLALGGMGGSLAEGAGMIGRAATNAGASGLQKYFSNLMDKKDDSSEGVLGNAALGGAISGGIDTAGGIAKWIGDKAMKASVGIKDVDQVGTKLADAGLWGTRGMMADQVRAKLPEAESDVQSVVRGLPGSTDAQPISDSISNLGNRFNLPSSGDVSPGMESYAQKVKDAAEGFQSMGEGGELTAPDLLAIKRQGDYLGYTNSGNPASSLESDIGRAQANKARELLNDLSGGATSDALGKEQALLLAKKPLEKAASIPSSLGGLFFQKAPAIVGSTVGQLSTKGGQSASALADPEVLQALFGIKNASN